MFDKSIYRERRRQLRKKVGRGLIFLPGNGESPANFKDNCYHFRQDSTFLYYCGLQIPGTYLAMDCEEDREWYFADDISMDDIIWSGPQPTIAERAAKAGLQHLLPLSEVNNFMRRAVERKTEIHRLPAYRAEHDLFWEKFNVSKISHTLIYAICEQREVKTPEEVEEMTRASTITAQMHMTAMREARPGMREYEVKALIAEKAMAGGGDFSFTPIITRNGHILHNHRYDNVLQEGDLLLVDCGAETAMGYAGDRTRTFPVSGEFSTEQREIYEVVLAAYKRVVDMAEPGMEYKKLHLEACLELASGLKDLGILKGDPGDMVESGAHALFMPHGLGHQIGLDVHDMENLGEDLIGYDAAVRRSEQFGLKSLRLGKKLKPGMALTVEPGCYFIPDLIRQWSEENKWKDFIDFGRLEYYTKVRGVRIEDDFLVTEDGLEMLGTEIPRDPDEIQELRKNTLNR